MWFKWYKHAHTHRFYQWCGSEWHTRRIWTPPDAADDHWSPWATLQCALKDRPDTTTTSETKQNITRTIPPDHYHLDQGIDGLNGLAFARPKRSLPCWHHHVSPLSSSSCQLAAIYLTNWVSQIQPSPRLANSCAVRWVVSWTVVTALPRYWPVVSWARSETQLVRWIGDPCLG